MCHLGFQQLYEQQSVQGLESPRQTVNRLVQEHKGTIEKVTVVGHSLGAGEKIVLRKLFREERVRPCLGLS